MTWDETDPLRAATLRKEFRGDVDDDDLQTYLASESEPESDDQEGQPQVLQLFISPF